jgi:hypothetical protein
MKQNKCVILGIDSGLVSGWGILVDGKYEDSGTANTFQQEKMAIEFAINAAYEYDLPMIVGREEWTPGWQRGKRSFKSIVGIGASWGRWEAAFEEYGFPKRRIFSVAPNKWRGMVLSLKPGKYDRVTAKMTAIDYCTARGWPVADNTSHDEAEALCIAYYMLYDERAAKILASGRYKKL